MSVLYLIRKCFIEELVTWTLFKHCWLHKSSPQIVTKQVKGDQDNLKMSTSENNYFKVGYIPRILGFQNDVHIVLYESLVTKLRPIPANLLFNLVNYKKGSKNCFPEKREMHHQKKHFKKPNQTISFAKLFNNSIFHPKKPSQAQRISITHSKQMSLLH